MVNQQEAMMHNRAQRISNEADSLTIDRGEATILPPEHVAGIAHDLGNFIQIAHSALNIIGRNPDVRAADLEGVVARAKTSLERAGAIIRQTMGVGRAAVATHARVATCLAEIKTMVEATWKDDIRVDLHIGGAPLVARCDPLALQSAILNLLLNARDAMPNGGVISIRARSVSVAPGVPGVEIEVADQGVGMTRETVLRALEPYFTTKHDGQGGVGLPMVERFAKEAGGRVLIDSECGVGTTVILQLPDALSLA